LNYLIEFYFVYLVMFPSIFSDVTND